MTNLESAYSVTAELPLERERSLTNDFPSSAHAEVYGMKEMFSFHQARLSDQKADDASLPSLILTDSSSADETIDANPATSFLPSENEAAVQSVETSDSPPNEKMEASGGFFDVVGAVLEGAGERLLDPGALMQNIGSAVLCVAAGALAVALLPEMVVVAGAVALTGLAVGAAVTSLPAVFHDADVVANPENHSLVEYNESHADLRQLGALGVDVLEQGVMGSLTVALRPLLAKEMLFATMSHSSIAITGSARGTVFTNMAKPIKLSYRGEVLRDIELPDGTYAHRVKSGEYEEFFGDNHPLAGRRKPYSASYEVLDNGDVVRETSSQIQTFKPDGNVVTQIKQNAQSTPIVSEAASEAVKNAYRDLPEEIRNLVASTTKVRLGETVPDAIPSLAGEKIHGPKGEIPFEDAFGVYIHATDEIGIRAGIDRLESVPQVLRHEVGHMVDKQLNFPSRNREFKRAFNRDFRRLPSDIREKLAYFVMDGKDGSFGSRAHSETFAEVFSALTQPYSGTVSQRIPSMVLFPLAKFLSVKPTLIAGGLAEYFPHTAAVVRNSLLDEGYMTPL
jgi:hypothetical protein